MKSTAIIVSNDILIVNKISGILLKRDYSISIEKSGLSSIVKILDENANLAILDLDMESNGGIDLINIIKKTKQNLPIITVSMDNSVAKLRKLKEAGVYYCVIKPIRIKELEDAIEAVELLQDKAF